MCYRNCDRLVSALRTQYFHDDPPPVVLVHAAAFRISVWATEPDAELPVKMGASGAAAKPPTTVFEVFQRTVENHGVKPALKFKDLSGVRITIER